VYIIAINGTNTGNQSTKRHSRQKKISHTSEVATPLHHFQLACGSCHESDVGRRADSVVGKVTGDINQLCSSNGCHDYNPTTNHPVGVTINPAISGNMPLDTTGRITCLTCHKKPPSSGNSINTDVSQDFTLYMPEGVQFCASCHTKMKTSLSRQSHWRSSMSVHLSPIKQGWPSTVLGKSGTIDDESRTCLGCHDQVTVTIPPGRETIAQKRLRWRNMRDHPIGMDYSNVALVKSSRYKYPLINDQIRLFDGKMGCGSCHNLYSNERKFLVQENSSSALCRQCHDR
jgi:predicted CXXCH cytochrome family protein